MKHIKTAKHTETVESMHIFNSFGGGVKPCREPNALTGHSGCARSVRSHRHTNEAPCTCSCKQSTSNCFTSVEEVFVFHSSAISDSCGRRMDNAVIGRGFCSPKWLLWAIVARIASCLGGDCSGLNETLAAFVSLMPRISDFLNAVTSFVWTCLFVWVACHSPSLMVAVLDDASKEALTSTLVELFKLAFKWLGGT